ncbi:PREDICTED: mesothelin-like protein, partial [Corvus brachyrhynchos]|uniref:mesothelin-like protein n=1 Tax=Corvus brachyrhynchos TaxID=85066 RepID=UPI0008164AC8
GSLGALVCDLEPATIPASGPAILDNLKLCPALTGAQQDALNALLLTGDTAYGDPSSWNLRTLQDLGPLVLALNQTTLSLVAEAAREDFRRSIVAAYSSQGHSQREKSLILLRAFAAASAASHPRLKRSVDVDSCLSEPITVDCIPFLTPEELNLHLSGDFLIKNLEAVLELPLITESLKILKKKVDQFFPSGIPEEQLKRLGLLSHLYTEQEISQWTLRCSDTLSALLNASEGWWTDSQLQQLLSRFLALGGSLTGPLLQQIGGEHLCKLQEEQIQQIPAEAIRTAGSLNISLCSQTKKEQFYRKAREAFAGLASTPTPYYCKIQPYLGGAPAEDLKNLANTGVAINMELATFLTLNPKELQKLSVTDVKNLLGKNLPELKEAENKPLVVSWVKTQSQRELDCVLGIGLQGGLQEPTGTAALPNPSSAPTATHSTVTPVPNPSSAPTATHSTVTPVPNPSSAPTATPVPHSTSVPAATTAPHTSPSPHKPTPIPSSTTSTQTSLSSSTAKPTTPPCQTSSPPGFSSPSSTIKPTPGGVPESPRPTSNGHINLQPEPGSGSRLSSCLVPVLAATIGNILLQGLL